MAPSAVSLRPVLAALSAVDPTALGVLARGQQGPAVKRWQEQLAQAGFLVLSHRTVVGLFGPRTQEATRRFQRAHGLAPSGEVGPATRIAMGSELKVLAGLARRPLARGQTGEAVRVWQSRLVRLGYLTQAQMDTGPGIFGPQTEAATRRFQADSKLPPDGRVDPATRSALMRALGRPAAPQRSFAVPYINQLTSNGSADDWNRLSNCGPTTMAMIAKGFGVRRDWVDGDLVNALGRSAGVGAAGVGWDGVISMARSVGLSGVHHAGNDAAWVREQLRQGKLVAANGDRSVTLQNGGHPERWGHGGGGHWIAVIGLAPNGRDFLVMDPSSDCRALSPGELERFFRTRAGGGHAVAIGR